MVTYTCSSPRNSLKSNFKKGRVYLLLTIILHSNVPQQPLHSMNENRKIYHKTHEIWRIKYPLCSFIWKRPAPACSKIQSYDNPSDNLLQPLNFTSRIVYKKKIKLLYLYRHVSLINDERYIKICVRNFKV